MSNREKKRATRARKSAAWRALLAGGPIPPWDAKHWVTMEGRVGRDGIISLRLPVSR